MVHTQALEAVRTQVLVEVCILGPEAVLTPDQEVVYTGPGGGAYSGPGGGLYTGPGGGLYTGPGGGLYTGPGGGMYTGPDSNPYMAKHPAWPLFVVELRKMGKHREADMIDAVLKRIGYK